MCTSAVCDVGVRWVETDSLMVVDGVPGPSEQAVLISTDYNLSGLGFN